MKWIKNKQKIQKDDWHLWFAWKPVVVHVYPDGNEEIAWMEKVLRRFVLDAGKPGIGVSPFWKPEYKKIPETKWISPVRWEPERHRPPLGGSMIDIPIDEPKVGLFDEPHPCSECEYSDNGGLSCMECMEVDHLEEEESPDLMTEEEMQKSFESVFRKKEPCSNCGSELDEDYNCTSKYCPLSTDEWKKPSCEFEAEDGTCEDEELAEKVKDHPIDTNWRRKHGKTIM